MGIFSKIMGTHSERELKRVYPIVDKIEAMGSAMEKLSDEELRAKTDEFKKRLSEGETLDDLLVEAYAVVREAATRVLGMRHYRVQLIGGVILHQGRIAEMKTGEGKTLVSTLPAYLNALEGKGVHIVTVNDYLANRDAEWMGEVHRFLGLSVGVILNSMNPDERRAAYQCDITYATNNELGFDYLRDNMAVYEKQLVQRELNYAIIDEVDSVLIDEARTPLIISGQSGKSTALYNTCDYLAKRMTKGERKGEINKMTVMMGEEVEETGDFIVNEKEKHVVLTEQGVKKVEEYFHLNNLADADNLEIQHVMTLALRANYLMFRDKNYVVKDGEVLIVDEFTGRIMPGRRYSDGLHQAIEAKEGVEVKRESRTLATITLQNFFNKYNKTAGMTGTALTEEEEFREIYGLDVIEIPPNKKVIRVDHDDLVFGTHREKINAIVEEIIETHQKGQPVLVGTITIEGSEEISNRLRKEGIPHTVLNAKFHEKEAEIVAHAGERGAVTIATNMAGRGTDIKLGDGVAELGGLKIIGTERHESRRIDNQLRGRAGRQGDPGDTRFFISLEDDLMRLFGSDKMMKVFNALSHEDGMAIEHKMLSNAVEKAQKKIESNNFAIRKNLLEYDQVNNEQRELIYEERRRVLKGESMHDEIVRMIGDVVKAEINDVIDEGQTPAEWNLLLLNRTLLPIAPIKPLSMNKDDYKGYTTERLIDEVTEQVKELYAKKEQEITEETGSAETFREVERVFLLKVIDNKWMSHIDDMDQLRQSISLQAYAQKDPVVEYRYAGIEMFEEMIAAISKDIVMIMLHIRKKPEVERKQEVKVTGTNKDDSGPKKPVQRKNKKVQPNDPCPCGKCYPDGRPIKYKNCCGRNQ
ncbi:MAG: preprotein translocase subunit SecA [Coprococcus catus]|uniref:Protein translocase subunit SecA n=1 Tax=Coprococcus intestinihominis TaxID=3133154 RepID=A0ABV1B6N1_9FIRM|nr:preprotein translocase subunit SecA [Coprococcus catus]MDD6344503.1 preprotein translocase subunit SecA [Coprococcus catus]MDY5989529.1 preprotein translocase subunit SecA [Coprococcus catus]